jgi:hypothetical protein
MLEEGPNLVQKLPSLAAAHLLLLLLLPLLLLVLVLVCCVAVSGSCSLGAA